MSKSKSKPLPKKTVTNLSSTVQRNEELVVEIGITPSPKPSELQKVSEAVKKDIGSDPMGFIGQKVGTVTVGKKVFTYTATVELIGDSNDWEDWQMHQ